MLKFYDSFVSANIMEIVLTKNKVASLKDKLIITSKDIAVLITVEAKIPAQSHDSVTIKALTCWDARWRHLVISNQNFHPLSKDSEANNTVYKFLSTHKLVTPNVTGETWQWLCELSTHWDECKCNLVHHFMVKVNILNQNGTNNSTRGKIPLHEYQGPAEPKPLMCDPKDIKDIDRPKSDLQENNGVNLPSQQANLAKKHKPTERTFSNRNRTEPKSTDRNGKNPRPTENKDGMDGAVKVEATNSSKEVNNTSSQVACGEAITLQTWMIFSVASVFTFLVGLAIGVFCRRPQARGPEQEPKPTEEKTDENIYDEVSFERGLGVIPWSRLKSFLYDRLRIV